MPLATVATGNSPEFVDQPQTAGTAGDTVLDGPSDTERVTAAAGAVESLEWELDRAEAALASAIMLAASNGCSIEKIAASAAMTKEDVATLLWAGRSERSEP